MIHHTATTFHRCRLGTAGVGLAISALCVLCVLCGETFADECEPAWDAPLGASPNGQVRSMIPFSDGGGDWLIVGGAFSHVNSTPASGVARYNADTGAWSGMAGGVTGWVEDFAVFDDGNGPRLYAGGNFGFAGGNQANNIARWNGLWWEALGSFPNFGVNDWVWAMAAINDGPGQGLYAAGRFTSAGGVAVNHIARWDGSQWHPLGSGVNAHVRALAVWDDGTGEALYAGGYFTTAGGISASGIARWNPVTQTWSALGLGVSAGGGTFTTGPRAVMPYNGELVVGGIMPEAGGQPVSHIARWTGSQWLPMTGGGVGGGGSAGAPTILRMHLFDDGDAGEALYVGGLFTLAGGVHAERVARWTIDGWSALGPEGSGVGPDDGNTPSVRAFASMQDSEGNVLHIGGDFQLAGGLASPNLAAWRGCELPKPPIPGDLNGDGSVGVADLLILLAAWGPCPEPPEPSGECAGSCGGQAPSGCYCDEDCDDFGDCCPDVCDGCPDLAFCGEPPGSQCPADLNGDGHVGVADLLILLSNWG